MNKFISKQSVAIWYALTALLATFIVGQVILWFFPDGSSMGASLLFILMNLIPLICGGCLFSCVEGNQIFGCFFQKGLPSKRKSPILGFSFFHPRHLLWDFHPAYERSLYWELPIGLLPLFPLDLFIWRSGRSRVALVFTRSSFL